MAARNRDWESLSEAYRKRLSRNGITKSRYERGANLQAVRGHGNTPEHGKKQAARNPVRYRDYLKKHEPRAVSSPEDAAHELNRARNAAYRNMTRHLADLRQYNEETVKANVYGGITSESGLVPGMSLEEARWTSRATLEKLRDRARYQELGNPWFYH
jgi:hypothetical protein